MPKSLTETICSMPERERGEMKLRAPGRLKTISLVLSVFILSLLTVDNEEDFGIRPLRKQSCAEELGVRCRRHI